MSRVINFVPLTLKRVNVSRYECSVNKVNYVSVSQELLSCSQLLIICDDLQYEKKNELQFMMSAASTSLMISGK